MRLMCRLESRALHPVESMWENRLSKVSISDLLVSL